MNRQSRPVLSSCPPGSHPHADQPNWKPADTAEAYLTNCREGLETYSDRRMAKLLGMSRVRLWRCQRMANIPKDVFEALVKTRTSSKALAEVGRYFAGERIPDSVERCPHCAGVIRRRPSISAKHRAIIEP